MVNRTQQAKASSSSSNSTTLTKSGGTSISRSSSSSCSSSGSSPKPVSKRMCAMCQNHGIKEPVRGHKRFCKHRLCTCKNCLLVKERQRIVALHLYVRRAQQQEEDAAEAAKAALSRAMPAIQASASPLFVNPEIYGAAIIPDNQHSNSVADAAVNSAFLLAQAEKQRNNLLFEALLKLRDRFQISDGAIPLLMCVLKSTRSVEEASELIKQSLAEVTAMAPGPGFREDSWTPTFPNMQHPFYL